MLRVGLEHSGDSFSPVLRLIGATVAIAALPLLEYLLFRMRARRTMPKVRDWMNGARVGREHHGLGDLPVLILD
jgi:hypothetical protein